ncbi:type IV toxin-antitoxin system AbiEi family antitoxin domain-containing protein [Cellulomonas massiliensis]|uniref:type IV toxin-antitoxin system AbiEi family antitoxin domain-containing protein n=1 Tax=Cellulomonas massiliensis TaxID=1465811 RepID=UPI0002D616F8|nr:type IV toxin-antitoxin system AbiEi family antitoxin domain-containing protein [Cellulomonas massiliensis]
MTYARGSEAVPLGRLAAAIAPDAAAVLRRQDGVATTAQLAAWGVSRQVAAARVRTGEWQRLHQGVLVVHAGPLAWRQRARAALLYAGPGAALSHRAAGHVHGVVAAPAVVDVAVPRARTVEPQAGVRVRRREVPFAGGRLRAINQDDTVVDLVAAAASDDEAVGLLCDAVRAGVLPGRVLVAAGERQRLRNRRLLLEVLDAVGEGVESPLEHRYARDVERAHRLPRARAQRRERVDGRWIRADRVYEGLGVRVELDGRLAHPSGRTDADVWRDNAVVLAHAELTLRYRWSHVAVEPCRTARQVGAALRAGGWRSAPSRCSAGCPVRGGDAV